MLRNIKRLFRMRIMKYYLSIFPDTKIVHIINSGSKTLCDSHRKRDGRKESSSMCSLDDMPNAIRSLRLDVHDGICPVCYVEFYKYLHE